MIVQNAELIQPSHWLISDAVQRSGASIATAVAHRRIAELLESESRKTQSPALLWDCGEHWLASGDSVRAIEVIRECARHSVDIGRPREAAQLLQRAAQIASGELRVGLARESVRLAHIGSEVDVILRGVEIVRAAGVPPAHDELEVAELIANSFLGPSTEETIVQLRHCLDDADSTLEHKLEVSVPLVVFCAQHQREALAHEAFDVLAPLFEQSGKLLLFRSLQFFLIYHANFGDPSEAIRIARDLVARTDWPIEQRADAHRHAGYGLWRCGLPREALATLRVAVTLAEKCGLSRLQFNVALNSASFYSELGDNEQTRAWLAHAEKIADEVPALRNNFDYLMIRTDIASATCDIGELRALYDSAQRLGVMPRNGRVSRWADTLKILLNHLSGESFDGPAAIRHLTRFHRHGDSGDTADFEMATALQISRVSEPLDVTRARLRRYVEHGRRTYLPLSPMLRQAIREIDPTSLPTANY